MKIKQIIDKIILQEMDKSVIATAAQRIPKLNNKPIVSDKSSITKKDIPFFVSDMGEDKYTKLIKIMINANRTPIQGSRFQYFPAGMDMNPKHTEEVPIIFLNHLCNLIILDHGIKLDKPLYRYFRTQISMFIINYLSGIRKQLQRDYVFDMSGL